MDVRLQSKLIERYSKNQKKVDVSCTNKHYKPIDDDLIATSKHISY